MSFVKKLKCLFVPSFLKPSLTLSNKAGPYMSGALDRTSHQIGSIANISLVWKGWSIMAEGFQELNICNFCCWCKTRGICFQSLTLTKKFILNNWQRMNLCRYCDILETFYAMICKKCFYAHQSINKAFHQNDVRLSNIKDVNDFQ